MYETLIRVILVMGDDRYRHGCKAAKKKLSRKVIAVVAAAAFAGAVLAVILIARTPMPL